MLPEGRGSGVEGNKVEGLRRPGGQVRNSHRV